MTFKLITQQIPVPPGMWEPKPPRRADMADNYLQPGAGVRAKDAERGLSVWAKAMQSASQGAIGFRPAATTSRLLVTGTCNTG